MKTDSYLKYPLCTTVCILLMSTAYGNHCYRKPDGALLKPALKEYFHGFTAHSEWIYHSDAGNVDTLRAINSYKENFIENGCSREEFGERDFLWNYCGEQMNSANFGLFITSKFGMSSETCMDIDGSYLNGSLVVPGVAPDTIEGSQTPTATYSTVLVIKAVRPDDSFFLHPPVGWVGYTLKKDTFRLH